MALAMNTHALIPLVATIAYIPLFVILLINRPWDRKQKFFLAFLIAAMLWSFSDFFFRSDLFVQNKLFLVKVVLCVMIWMLIQFHYFLSCFFRPQNIKIPVAYVFPVSTVVLALLGYIPAGIEITDGGINVDYGIWIIAIGFLFLFTLGSKDIYSLVRRRRISPDPSERNQITYLLAAIVILVVSLFSIFAPRGGEYPIAHFGNFANACILTYAVVARHLLDVRVVLRRGLMWAGYYGCGIGLFALVLFLIHRFAGFDIDFATLTLSFAIGLPLIIFLFHRVRGPWGEGMEHAFVRERYHYRRKLSEFTAKARSVLSLEEFGSELVSLLSQSIGCPRACLLLPHAEGQDFSARFVYPPAENNPMRKLRFRADSPVLTWLRHGAQILPERNLSILPEFAGMWQEEREEIRSAQVDMFVSLTNEGEVVAVLAVGSKEGNQLYAVEDLDLVESVATSVAASMKKEYLHEQQRERDEELTLINRLTTVITSSVNVKEIFESFADDLKEFIDVEWATLSLIQGGQLHFLALSSTIGSAWQTGESIPLNGTATEWVCAEKKSLYEADLARHYRFWTGEYHLNHGIRSLVYLPLIAEGRAIGSLILGTRRPNAYSRKQIRILEHLASQIAMPVENSQLYAKVEKSSRIDELTGLFNRRHFEEQLNAAVAVHSRYGGVFSLLLLDLDGFKTYNDIYGHPSGDEVLHQIGGIVKSSIRSADQGFRYGGDEFVVILPQTTVDDACTVGERVRGQIAAEMKEKEIAVTCSIGLASYPSDGLMSSELVTSADTALYYAKRTGGNRVYLSSKILSEPAPESGIYTRGSGLSAVYALAAAVEARDPYVYGHSRKVSAYAVALAEAIGLSPDEVTRISTAALLHDIGKIAIPDSILNKKGKLRPEDWEIVKSHPRLGANIVANVPSLVPCRDGILYHHEHWDGGGYPEGLKGEAIALDARILAIADAFDAMVSSRPYRDAYCHEKAIEELKKAAGIAFDPELVVVFIGIVQALYLERVKVGEDLVSEQPDS
jgi:diguanylate cyclase (GGDEF)-like protein/putative nucleotidyltransferase with HDIG domain